MIGAIAGDVVGSVYEHHNIKRTDFTLFDPYCHFTDDTVMILAVADAIVTGSDYGDKLKEWYRRYPNRGYGRGFRKWAASEKEWRRMSMGNGSAMRVSPVGFVFHTLEDVLEEAQQTALPSHGHSEGIKGAQVVAGTTFLARTGSSKTEIRDFVVERFRYDLSEPLDEIRRHYRFDATCPGSVPQAITAFLESESYEDAIRKAISIGGDSDTIACIAGGIAEAYYGGVPDHINEKALSFLDETQRGVVGAFSQRYHR
jgi:ADP-ribosylglycohydrolase